MAKSFVDVPDEAVRIKVGENTTLVAWQSVYNGVKQISFGKQTQYKEDGDIYTKMAPPITDQVWLSLALLANGHLFSNSSDVALAIDEAEDEAIEAPTTVKRTRKGAR